MEFPRHGNVGPRLGLFDDDQRYWLLYLLLCHPSCPRWWPDLHGDRCSIRDGNCFLQHPPSPIRIPDFRASWELGDVRADRLRRKPGDHRHLAKWPRNGLLSKHEWLGIHNLPVPDPDRDHTRIISLYRYGQHTEQCQYFSDRVGAAAVQRCPNGCLSRCQPDLFRVWFRAWVHNQCGVVRRWHGLHGHIQQYGCLHLHLQACGCGRWQPCLHRDRLDRKRFDREFHGATLVDGEHHSGTRGNRGDLYGNRVCCQLNDRNLVEFGDSMFRDHQRVRFLRMLRYHRGTSCRKPNLYCAGPVQQFGIDDVQDYPLATCQSDQRPSRIDRYAGSGWLCGFLCPLDSLEW